MSYILTRTERGRKMVQISAIDANKMVEDGKADPIKRGVLYIDRALSRPKTQAPEDLDSVVDEEPESTPLQYETRELKASSKQPMSRRQTRRMRNRSKPDDSE
jgi:hypothetical protein